MAGIQRAVLDCVEVDGWRTRCETVSGVRSKKSGGRRRWWGSPVRSVLGVNSL